MSKTTICFKKDCEFRKQNGKCKCKITVIDENGNCKNYVEDTPVDPVVCGINSSQGF